MSRDSHSERLRRLEAKIAAAKGGEERPSHNEQHYSQGQLAWRMVTELVAGLLIGFGIGLGLDTLLGTGPILMIVFIGLGFAAGINVMLRTAKEVGQKRPDSDIDASDDQNGAGSDDTGVGGAGRGE